MLWRVSWPLAQISGLNQKSVIFCVVIACHSKESTRLRNIYAAVREYYYCILHEGKMSIMLRKMLKNRIYSVRANVTPGRMTNRLYKKSELMLMRCATAAVKFRIQVVLVYLQYISAKIHLSLRRSLK